MKLLFLHALLLVAPVRSFSPYHHGSSVSKTSTARWSTGACTRTSLLSTSCLHALTPIGPFCPFRSSASEAAEPGMEKLHVAGPEFATEMARIQLDMQMGQSPDPERLRTVANAIDSAVDSWEELLTRLNIAGDFQTREYAKLTQAHLQRHGQDANGIAKMMRWQGACMRAMADNQPPPMPPPDIDIMKMMQDAQGQAAKSGQDGGEGGQQQPPSISAMSAAEKITSTPFSGKEAPFENEAVREEYERLCRDHQNLIEFGSKYDTFDALGKIAYLDEVERIEDRWDIFFTRASLMGAVNSEFVRQCDAFLESMSLTEQDFRSILEEAHKIMREDAEKERNMVA
mmetsp:Transcript_35253/g.77209  ORF Transcript_35253/g.77209 Transcript_35253/m.77209 type:complete len:343 (+) Transcript_35253:102-1130(+)